MLRATALALVMSAAALGCSERPVFNAGEACALNSDCEAPLVCRLERCRPECGGSRDCAVGSICVFDEDGLGSCRLPDESTCMLNSECPPPLVCRFGQCTNECAEHDDCLAGSFCRPDEGTGELGCFDPAQEDCDLDSDCTPPLVCKQDGRCREECIEHRDCRDNWQCVGPEEQRVCMAP
jgi:hypothetical protein